VFAELRWIKCSTLCRSSRSTSTHSLVYRETPPFHPETSDAVRRQLARSARRLNFDERAGENVPAAATGMSAATAGSANRTCDRRRRPRWGRGFRWTLFRIRRRRRLRRVAFGSPPVWHCASLQSLAGRPGFVARLGHGRCGHVTHLGEMGGGALVPRVASVPLQLVVAHRGGDGFGQQCGEHALVAWALE